jgi:hypothetical protein
VKAEPSPSPKRRGLGSFSSDDLSKVVPMNLAAAPSTVTRPMTSMW